MEKNDYYVRKNVVLDKTKTKTKTIYMHSQDITYDVDIFSNHHNYWYNTKFTSNSAVNILEIYRIVQSKTMCIICGNNTVYTKLHKQTVFTPQYYIQRKKYCIPCLIEQYSKYSQCSK